MARLVWRKVTINLQSAIKLVRDLELLASENGAYCEIIKKKTPNVSGYEVLIKIKVDKKRLDRI